MPNSDNEIKYGYALDENEKLISIEELTEENRRKHTFKCISCKNELVPNLGKIRRHYFSHKADCACSGETYRHNLAKLMFEANFYSAKSLYVPVDQYVECSDLENCKFKKINRNELLGQENAEQFCNRVESVNYDLKKNYDLCTIENGVENFIADVLLEDSTGQNPPFLVEMVVTHKCSEEKINSGLPILEIKIDSEDDAKELLTCNIIKGELYNFKIKDLSSPLQRKCYNSHFILDEMGENHIETSFENCGKINTIKYPNALFECSFADVRISNELGLLLAKQNGFEIYDCSLCKHYLGEDSRMLCNKENPNFPAGIMNKSKAVNCSGYEINQSRIRRAALLSRKCLILISKEKEFNKSFGHEYILGKKYKPLNMALQHFKGMFENDTIYIKQKRETINLKDEYKLCREFSYIAIGYFVLDFQNIKNQEHLYIRFIYNEDVFL